MSKRKIDDLLSERHRRFTPLQKLLHHAANQDAWSAQLQALLPEPLSRDCRVSDIQGDVLIVACRTAACATRLRFHAESLLADLGQLADFRRVKRVQIRVSAS